MRPWSYSLVSICSEEAQSDVLATAFHTGTHSIFLTPLGLQPGQPGSDSKLIPKQQLFKGFDCHPQEEMCSVLCSGNITTK